MTFKLLNEVLHKMPIGSRVDFARYIVSAKICKSTPLALYDIRNMVDGVGNCQTWVRRQKILDTFSFWAIASKTERKKHILKIHSENLSKYWDNKELVNE